MFGSERSRVEGGGGLKTHLKNNIYTVVRTFLVNMSIIYRSFTMVDSICIACVMLYQVGMRDVRLRFLLCVVILGLFSEFRVSEINYEIKTLGNRQSI